MNITIHRGTQEIGGSCVEITTPNTRIILDLGLPLVNKNREPFDSQNALREGLVSLKSSGVIPAIKGLFDSDSPSPDAILLSHAHLDHSGLLPYTQPSIPIYTSRGTSKMMLAGSIFARQPRLERNRFQRLTAQKTTKIGDFRITPFAVDHSIFGSQAFVIQAEGKTILYSGDFRGHGRKPGMLRDLLNYCQTQTIDALIVEGTHLGSSRPQGSTEQDLESDIIEHLCSAPSLVGATFSALDVDRIVTLYRACQKTNRVFVVDAYTAFVMYLIASEIRIPQPRKENGIRVYLNQSFRNRKLSKLEKIFQHDQISLDEILNEPHKHLMVIRPSMVKLDFAGTLPEKITCLYGYWEGYLNRPDWQTFQSQIEKANGTFIQAHVSGHVYIADLFETVRRIRPQALLPIHTFEPQMFGEEFPQSVRLQDGIPFAI